MSAKDERYDLNDVTRNAPFDEAETEEADEEVDEFADHMGDDLDLEKDDFASETFHGETLPEEP